MNINFLKASAIAVSGLLATVAACYARTRIDVHYAQQPDAPVRIVSMKKTLNDQLEQLTVENSSERQVINYTIGWVVMLPDRCAEIPMTPMVTIAPVEEIAIAPGKTSTTGAYRLWLKDLLNVAREHRATLIHVQVGVVSAKFADGSSWDFDLSRKQLFDPALLDHETHDCSGGSVFGTAPLSSQALRH